jgi:uncharacterized membrane protein YdcZ (DUF606 family)
MLENINWKYWISSAVGAFLLLFGIITEAGNQNLIDRENKSFKWFVIVGSVVSLSLNGADKNKPWLPASTASSNIKKVNDGDFR